MSINSPWNFLSLKNSMIWKSFVFQYHTSLPTCSPLIISSKNYHSLLNTSVFKREDEITIFTKTQLILIPSYLTFYWFPVSDLCFEKYREPCTIDAQYIIFSMAPRQEWQAQMEQGGFWSIWSYYLNRPSWLILKTTETL
jgi:hypothetical protein